MRVIDAIEVISEHEEVWIIDNDSGDVVAIYDSRNAIPKCFNENTIKCIRTRSISSVRSILCIEI